jgi:Family of unknown function (DUF6498)
VERLARLIEFYRVTSSTLAIVALVIANAIPLVGVVFFDWNVWSILIVYWIENGIVGFYNILKIGKAEGTGTSDGSVNWQVNGRPASQLGKASMIPFFVMHYGIFWAVHGVFVLTLPVFGAVTGDTALEQGANPLAIALAVVALFISHGLSYWFNFIGRGEYRRVSPAVQMFTPYGRLVVLHITIIVGALAISFTGAPAALVAILVVLKTAMDIGFHVSEHRRASPTAEAATAARGSSANA